MGRFKIGVALLAVLLAAAIGAQFGMQAAQKPVTQALTAALEQVQQEHFPQAEALVSQARGYWDSTRTFRAALADILLRLKAIAEAHALNLSTFF